MEPLAPDSYAQFLTDLKSRIQAAQLRASVAVSRELVLLYWQIGRDILDRQQRESWGAKVIDRLAMDLKREFPDMKGFSLRNLKYMRRFAEVWAEDEFVQQVAAQLPWFHNCVLLDKVADREERIWYARAAIHHGWSRAVLVHQIESGLHRRQGKAITNFDRALPSPQSDLAQEVTKDPYSFDFLMLGAEARPSGASPKVPARAGSRLRLRRQPVFLDSWRRRVPHRSALLSPQIALLRGDRSEDGPLPA